MYLAIVIWGTWHLIPFSDKTSFNNVIKGLICHVSVRRYFNNHIRPYGSDTIGECVMCLISVERETREKNHFYDCVWPLLNMFIQVIPTNDMAINPKFRVSNMFVLDLLWISNVVFFKKKKKSFAIWSMYLQICDHQLHLVNVLLILDGMGCGNLST